MSDTLTKLPNGVNYPSNNFTRITIKKLIPKFIFKNQKLTIFKY